MSGSNPPSTNGSPRRTRRAIRTGASALFAVALPIALVAATGGVAASDPGPAAASSTNTSFLRGQLELIRAHSASEAVQAQELVSAATPAVIEVPPAAPTTPAPPAPAPAPAPARPRTVGDPNDPASWDRLARCESGGNWAISTGNGYYGGIQFSLGSWQSVGGTGYPHENTRETQIEMGKRLYARGGWGSWPSCTRSFGWR